jgi:hypothetical protein
MFVACDGTATWLLSPREEPERPAGGREAGVGCRVERRERGEVGQDPEDQGH